MITAGVDLIHEKYEKGIHSAKKMSAVILLSCFKVHIPNGGDAPTNLRSAQTLANSAQGVIRPGIISIQVRGCYSLQLQGKLYSPSSGPSFFVAPSSFLEHSATSSKPDLFSRPTWRKPSVSQCIGSEGSIVEQRNIACHPSTWIEHFPNPNFSKLCRHSVIRTISSGLVADCEFVSIGWTKR